MLIVIVGNPIRNILKIFISEPNVMKVFEESVENTKGFREMNRNLKAQMSN